MTKNQISEKYEKQWVKRTLRAGGELFDQYERNWVLPKLFRRKEKVLDPASGNSIVGSYLQDNYQCQVTALDISETAIANAKKRGVKGVVGSVEKKLPFKDKSFDTVFWGDNIEHVFTPADILHEIYRVLKPSGRVIISTPNQGYWRYRLYTLLTGSLPKTEGEDNKPWEWTHIRFFNRHILKQLLDATGFTETSFLPVSRRRLDIPFLKLAPALFGMIMIVEATKK